MTQARDSYPQSLDPHIASWATVCPCAGGCHKAKSPCSLTCWSHDTRYWNDVEEQAKLHA